MKKAESKGFSLFCLLVFLFYPYPIWCWDREFGTFMSEIPESHDLSHLSDGFRGAFPRQFLASGDCVVQNLRMGVDVGDAFADRIRGCDDVGSQLFLEVSVAYFAFVPLLIEVSYRVRS